MNREQKIADIYNQFTGRNLDVLDLFYADHVTFCDPIKEVNGLNNLKKYYSHVYKNVESIRFDFHRFIASENYVSGEWKMTLKAKSLNSGKPFEVKGCSVFEFNDQNMVVFHRDYLDLGEMVYERIPLLGSVIKTLKKAL